jgi:LmbE family N-acetylglucosaminyl deacetylase
VPHIFVPDGAPVDAALARTYYLGIGAHPDDLELVGLPWIHECWGRPDRWFSGIVCGDGARSPRTGAYADRTDDEMVRIRANEQRSAAEVGRYGALVALGLPTAETRDVARLAAELEDFIRDARPELVVTHDPFDRHATHTAVTRAVLAALRNLEPEIRPKRLLAIEGWRSLDWAPREHLVAVDGTGAGPLGHQLLACFKSQIEGGKRYDLAAEGRRRANATYADPYGADQTPELVLALDLTPLLEPDAPTLSAFAANLVDAFGREALLALSETDEPIPGWSP